jgi:alkylation response protein AidB-like acyl-CoA dehydrogenase
MARSAIDAAVELAGVKASDNGAPLAARAHVRTDIADSTASLRGAWLGLLDAARAVDEAATTPVGVTARHRATLRAAMCHVADVGRDVTSAMYRIGSSASLYRGQQLEQIFRDVHAAAQHGLLNHSVFELAGTVLLGGVPDAPMY